MPSRCSSARCIIIINKHIKHIIIIIIIIPGLCSRLPEDEGHGSSLHSGPERCSADVPQPEAAGLGHGLEGAAADVGEPAPPAGHEPSVPAVPQRQQAG